MQSSAFDEQNRTSGKGIGQKESEMYPHTHLKAMVKINMYKTLSGHTTKAEDSCHVPSQAANRQGESRQTQLRCPGRSSTLRWMSGD